MRIRPKRKPEVVGLLAVGLDGDDGHHRLTQADGALIVGGSAETHDRLQGTVAKVTERLGRKGKCIRDASADELSDLIREIQE